MPWPLSQDYNEAVQNPALRFSDAELKQTEARGNAIGIPMARSGNFADVYEMTGPGGKKWAVKCFTREVPDLRERYAAISAYLKQANLPFMVDFSYLEQGVKVKGQWYPVLKMDWVEGFVLNQFVKEHADNPPVLDLLCQIWVRLARRLREAHMAHCDLQHGNVLLVPGSTAKSLAVKLIDYDGMFVPALAKTKSGEVGHPAYQHPQRLREGTYTAEVDRFPHLVIYTALRSLMVGSRYLWNKYDNGDNLLFRQSDLEAPSKSPLFGELMKLNDPEVRKLAQTLAQAAQKPLEQAPLLDDLVGSSMGTTARRKSAVVMPSAAAAPATKETSAEAIFADATAETGERRARRAKKSYLGAAVVGGVALVGLIVGGVILAMNGKSKTPGPEVAVAPTDPERPAPVVEPGKSGPMKDPDPVKDPPRPEAPQPPLLSFVGHTGPVKCLVLTPDGKQVISCGGWPKGDYTIRVWDLANGKQLRHFNVDDVSPPPGGDGPQFAALALSPDGNRLLAGTSHRLALMWDLATGKELCRLEGHEGGIQAATFTPDGRQALTGCADNIIRVWDSATGKLVKELKGHKEWVRALAVTPDGKKLLSGGRDKTVFLWDLEEGELLRQFEGEHPGWIEMVVVSRDGKTALSAGNDIRVWDVDTGRMIRELENSKNGNLCLAWSPDEKWVAAAGYNRTVRLWNFATGKQVAALSEHRNWVWDVVFTKDGKYLLSVGGGQGKDKNDQWQPGDDFAIRRWDLAHYLYNVEEMPKQLTNSLGMKLALIPAGKFLMGSPASEAGRQEHEGPQHEVTLTRPFYMGIHEVTVGQFRQFVQATGYITESEKAGGTTRLFPDGKWLRDPGASWKKPGFAQTDAHPVVCVTWNDATAFCDWLSQQEGQLYRLPTEAEWEYGCRAGSTTRFIGGDDDSALKDVANVRDAAMQRKYPNLGGVPWDDGHPNTAPVGSFQPNAFGLFDMLGNAWEWCQDRYDAEYYRTSPKEDPPGASAGNARVVRGGSWSSILRECRPAQRRRITGPSWGPDDIGFRVCRLTQRGYPLFAESGGDGSFEVVKEDGVELRRGTLRETGDYRPYMYFRVPELAPRSKQPVYIQVVYRHAGPGPLRAHYNSVNNDNYRYANVVYANEPIGTSQTRTAVIELPEPDFRQAQNQKSDLRLINPDKKQPLRVISATLYVEPTPLFIRSNTGSSMPPPPVIARRPLPVPDAGAQEKALQQIKDLFKEDYAKRKPADHLVLAGKLLKQAAQTKDDAAGRYVLYREARDLAAQAGDPVQAFKAIDDIAKEFAAPAPPLRALVVEKVSTVARTQDALKTLAETAMAAVDEAVDVDDYGSATRILKVAESAARRINNNALVKTVLARRKVVDGLSLEFSKIREAVKTLEMKPDDADANLAMGRFLCFHKEQWRNGLPLLAKGADQQLRDLARKDLAAPADPAEQVAVGDGWWALALKAQGPTKPHLQRQACAWYERALPRLTDLVKAKVDKRLKDVGATVGRSQPKQMTNSIGMKLTLIPSGRFQMGSPSTEPDRADSETQHEVSISKAFHMAVHKVTVGQFKAFVKDTGYRTDAERGGGSQAPLGADGKWGNDPKANWLNPTYDQTDDHPVVCISWNDAQAFCIWLSRKEKKNYALPTEAQWEYACRAGTQSKFGFGNTDAELPQYAWYRANAGKTAHPVGQRKPNAWGLYDMHGNAWEWCQDFYDPDYYKTSPRQDPPGPAAGGNRVARGGAWNSSLGECRCAHRMDRAQSHRSVGFGFRVVLVH